MTPAQANLGMDFVTDVPVQGPTDEGMRRADCWFARNVLPAQPACADCEGPIPMWAQRSLSTVRGESAGIGEQVSFGGAYARGFGVGATGDPVIWQDLSSAQQAWVMDTLIKLNDLIVKATGTRCATWATDIESAGKCFQGWYNQNYIPINQQAKVLRIDGVFDEDTLCALMLMAALNPQDFPKAFPDPEKRFCQVAPEKKKLSTGAMVGIAAAGAAALGGVVYVATRKKSRR